jgi:cell division protein FtsI/penicillin-binding protein 2
MPEINSPENSRLEEIEELERQLAEKKAAANIESGMNQVERQMEISRENLPEFQTQIAAPTPTSQAAQTDVKSDKKKEIEQDARSIAAMDETRKVETLVAIALEKGITYSIEVANSLQDPYILDTLHDKLIGELHDRLVKENKLKDL